MPHKLKLLYILSKKKLKLILFTTIAAISPVSFAFLRDVDIVQLFDQYSPPGRLAGIVFIILYVVFTTSFVPRAALSITGGFLFGTTLGTLYSLVASTITAAASFMIARYLVRDWVETKAAGKVIEIKEGIDSMGWKFVALTRLLPIIPFSILNYSFGLTRIPFTVYIIHTVIFIIPICTIYSYLGETGQRALGLFG